MSDAAIIEVPAGTVVQEPIQVLNVNIVRRKGTSAEAATATYPKLLVRVGEGAELRIKQSYCSLIADESTGSFQVANLDTGMSKTSLNSVR
jgi:autonomous glycyl radical cofactor GrcA